MPGTRRDQETVIGGRAWQGRHGMSWGEIARYEWMILLGLPLALLLWEWRNIRREIRRAREADEAKRQG
jgi:hypothetical protein